ncbi:MAG: transposase [Oligoflexia bacterium]|nr:transposase [Oligoflexia bacterium]MBF0367803.1 transposase [Oligoflexia bacterium]
MTMGLKFQYSDLQYERRQPEKTILHRVIRENFVGTLRSIECAHAESGGGFFTPLPYYVKNEFLKFLDCGILEKGFLRLHCASCNASKLVGHSCKCRGICPVCGNRRMANTAANLVDQVIPLGQVRQWVLSLPFQIRYILAYNSEVLTSLLGIYFRVISSYYILAAKKMGLPNPRTAAVTFVQRFGGQLNLNIHFHTLFSDGFFYTNKKGIILFKKIKAPSTEGVEKINKKIIKRFVRALRKRGFLNDGYKDDVTCDYGHAQNEFMTTAMAASIGRKIAWGSRRGCKVQRIGQTNEVAWKPKQGLRLSYINGFSLHANVMVKSSDRVGLEELCRYVARPALSNSRISEDEQGNIIYALKIPYTDGTTHLKFTIEEFIVALVALIPPPRVHLVRYHGLLGPNCKDRKKVIPIQSKAKEPKKESDHYPPKEYWIKWDKLYQRVFKKDALICTKCGGTMKIVADITDPEAIKKILSALGLEDSSYTIKDGAPRINGPTYYPSD